MHLGAEACNWKRTARGRGRFKTSDRVRIERGALYSPQSPAPPPACCVTRKNAVKLSLRLLWARAAADLRTVILNQGPLRRVFLGGSWRTRPTDKQYVGTD